MAKLAAEVTTTASLGFLQQLTCARAAATGCTLSEAMAWAAQKLVGWKWEDFFEAEIGVDADLIAILTIKTLDSRREVEISIRHSPQAQKESPRELMSQKPFGS